MIWGMTLEPGKLYTEVMREEVQLSMAAIDSRKDLGKNQDSSFCQILMKTERGEYVLCTLIHGAMFQQSLDLKIMPREKVTFSVQGSSVVYLVGYTASYPEDEDDHMREDELEGSEGSSAWEAFESEDSFQMKKIKEEPVEVLDDLTSQDQLLQGVGDPAHHPPAHQQSEQPHAGEVETRDGGVQGQMETTGVNAGNYLGHDQMSNPDALPGLPQEDVNGMGTTDNGTSLSQTNTVQDYFYPEMHGETDVMAAPLHVPYETSNLATSYSQETLPGALPSTTEQFIPPQATPVQSSQAAPIRPALEVGGTVLTMNTQRNFPPQRLQGASRRKGRPTGRRRSTSHPVDAQSIPQVPHESLGYSQQNIPGPSKTGMATGGYHCTMKHQQINPTSEAFRPPRAHRTARRRGSPKNEVRYKCQFCSKTYADMSPCRRHERTHLGIRPYECAVCLRTFHRKDLLTKHIRIHDRQSNFVPPSETANAIPATGYSLNNPARDDILIIPTANDMCSSENRVPSSQ